MLVGWVGERGHDSGGSAEALSHQLFVNCSNCLQRQRSDMPQELVHLALQNRSVPLPLWAWG